MNVYEIDPTKDERWDEFLQNHPVASVFHTWGWLEALRRTYGYQPIAFTTAAPGAPLTNGLLFCQISSWLNRRRLVSLPFSDHCAALVEDSEQLAGLLGHLQAKVDGGLWSYIELRTAELGLPRETAFRESEEFAFHKLDLRPNLDTVFHNFHKDCVQRKIQRAKREGLTYEKGRSASLVTKFYNLLLLTRRRHGLPPPPIEWFQNLVACLGDKAKIQVASKDGRPVASIVTLRHKDTLVYKYGCSDRRFSNLGGTQLLLWSAIQEAKNDQLSEVDFGRSDHRNAGLVAFKDRWGAARTDLTYFSYPTRHIRSAVGLRRTEIRKYVWSHVPSRVLVVAGRVLYKYIG
jgi:hypothetical protein